jgi:hypothetical protein
MVTLALIQSVVNNEQIPDQELDPQADREAIA